ncbi:hypothetical protein HYU40_05195 [Candidatus Woesearchaeota archaeon]|nr:hypothetical protein [Candidatus Woesearchaeota archaeon]
MLQNKAIHVYVVGDANAFLFGLKQEIEQELLQNKTGTFLQTLFQSIATKKEELKRDPFYGIQIPKKLIPKKYTDLYDVKNLWKCNLALAWRAIYFISGEEERIVVSIVDLIDHRTYEKIFGYRKG